MSASAALWYWLLANTTHCLPVVSCLSAPYFIYAFCRLLLAPSARNFDTHWLSEMGTEGERDQLVTLDDMTYANIRIHYWPNELHCAFKGLLHASSYGYPPFSSAQEGDVCSQVGRNASYFPCEFATHRTNELFVPNDTPSAFKSRHVRQG